MVRDNKDSKKGYFYLDGVRKDIASTATILNVTGTNTLKAGTVYPTYSAYFYTGRLNDIRVYDHALSPKEIKQISQGLILHYALDGVNNTNVQFGYQELEYIESSGSSYFDTGCKFNPETDSCKVIFKGNDTSNNGMIFASSSDKYFWFYYYRSGSRINIYADNGSGQQYVPGILVDTDKHVMEWKEKHYWLDDVDRGTLSRTYTETTYNIWLFSWGDSSYPFKGRIYYTDICRDGVYKRIFIPAKRLSDNAIGMYDIITGNFYTSSTSTPFTAGPVINTPSVVYDSSGYENNGRAYNTLTTSSNAAKHNCCINFVNSFINAPFYPLEETTISFWINRNVLTNTRQFIYTGWNGISIELTDSNGWQVYYTYGNGSYEGTVGCSPSTHLQAGVWYHCALVIGISGVKFYINGVCESTNTYKKPYYNVSIVQIGNYSNYYNFNAKLSDFRVYATALSAEDILSLYNKSATIDYSNAMYAYDYIEDDISKVNIKKTGIVNSSDIKEPDSISNVSFNKDGLIKVNCFYEI